MVRRNKDGSLTDAERAVTKALLEDGWRNQDIVTLVNIGRESTVNIGRISDVKKNTEIKPAAKDVVDAFVKKKHSYDYQTGLNLYDDERVIRAREAMALAVHVFNSPTVRFKTELFCVNAVIAWTYVLHEFYLRDGKKIEGDDGRTLLLSQILKRTDCPLPGPVKKNISAIGEVRNEVEHKILRKSDHKWFGLFQACCLNFDRFLREQFGERTSLGSDLAVAIQFSTLNIEQIEIMQQYDLPPYVSTLDARLEGELTDEDRAGIEYEFRVVYALTSASKSGSHIRFIRPGSEEGRQIHNILVKEKALDDLYPFKAGRVVAEVQKKTGKRFTLHDHTQAWKSHKARPDGASKSPEATNKDFCMYHAAHADYTYSQRWVDFLASNVK